MVQGRKPKFSIAKPDEVNNSVFISDATKKSISQKPKADALLMSREDFAKKAGPVFLPGDERVMVKAEIPIGPGKFWIQPDLKKVRVLHPLTHETFLKMSKQAKGDAIEAIKKGWTRISNIRNEVNIMLDSKALGADVVKRELQKLAKRINPNKEVFIDDFNDVFTGRYDGVDLMGKIGRK